MRIGMKEAIDQDLFKISAKNFRGQTGGVHLHQAQRADFRDLLARNVFHCKYARGGVVVDRLRNDDVLELAQTLAQFMKVRAFALKIQFMQQTPTQIREHVREFIALADFSMRVDKLGNLPERSRTVTNCSLKAGPCNLSTTGPPMRRG